MHGGGHRHLGQPGGHELQQRHLGGGVLHGHPVGVEVGVAAASLELLAAAGREVVDQDLLGEGERAAEALAPERRPARRGGRRRRSTRSMGVLAVTAMPAPWWLVGSSDRGGILAADGGRLPRGEARPLRCDDSVDKSQDKLRAADSLPGDRRRAASPASLGGEFARGTPPALARPSCRAAYAASRVTVRRALEVLRGRGPGRLASGVRLVRGRRPAAPEPGSPRHHRGPAAAEAGVRSERRILDFGFVAAPPRVREVLGARRGAAGAAGQPGRRRRRSRWSRCGAPRRSAPSCRGPTSSARRSTSCSTVELGGRDPDHRCRRGHRERRRAARRPAGSPVLRCERVTAIGRRRARCW